MGGGKFYATKGWARVPQSVEEEGALPADNNSVKGSGGIVILSFESADK